MNKTNVEEMVKLLEEGLTYDFQNYPRHTIDVLRVVERELGLGILSKSEYRNGNWAKYENLVINKSGRLINIIGIEEGCQPGLSRIKEGMGADNIVDRPELVKPLDAALKALVERINEEEEYV